MESDWRLTTKHCNFVSGFAHVIGVKKELRHSPDSPPHTPFYELKALPGKPITSFYERMALPGKSMSIYCDYELSRKLMLSLELNWFDAVACRLRLSTQIQILLFLCNHGSRYRRCGVVGSTPASDP